jgi:hypothetical protein
MKLTRIAIIPFLVVSIVLTACSSPLPPPSPTASPVEADRPSAIGSAQTLSEEEARAFQPTSVKVGSDRLQCVTAEYAIAPAWSPDDARLAYGSSNGTIALAAIDNLRTPHIIVHTPGTEQAPIRWIDNEHLLYVRYPARAGPTQKSIEDRYGLSTHEAT